MAEYIEREAIIIAIMESKNKNPHTKGTMHVMHDHEHMHFLRMVAMLPAADVAPVVRCKDCQRWDADPDTYGSDYGPKGLCRKFFETTTCDDFCSYGESADGGTDNA